MQHRPRLVVLAALGAATLALTACGPGSGSETGSASSAAAESSHVVKHAMGETEVPANPERVVVLDTGELDAVISLGVKPVGAVTTDVSTALVSYLEDDLADTKPVGTIGEPNLEAIAALQPDLILSNTVRHKDIYSQLSQIAPTVFAGDVGDTWKETLRLAGDALGKREKADELIAQYEARAAEVGKEVTNGAPGDVEVSIVRFLPGQIRLYGEASFIGTVLADAGFARPKVQQVNETFVEVSPEEISKADGDVIFTTTYGKDDDTQVAEVTGGPLWSAIPAVKAGDVHQMSDDVWMLGIGVTAANLVLDDISKTLG